MGSVLDDVADFAGNAVDAVMDNPMAMMIGAPFAAPLLGPAAAGGAGIGGTALMESAIMPTLANAGAATMLPPTIGISQAIPTAAEIFGTPAVLGGAGLGGVTELATAAPALGMGANIGTGIGFPAGATDALFKTPQALTPPTTGGIGMTDAMRAASMMGGGQQQPMPRAPSGGGRMPNPQETNLDQLAPQGTGFPQIADTASVLDEIIMMGGGLPKWS